MDLKNLTTFKTVVETGSYSAAAELLGYTPSTITFQINQLEEDLQVKLFEKMGRTMIPTAEGKNLLPYVEEVLSSFDKLRCFESDPSQYQGEIRIGVGETLLSYKMPEIFREFVNTAPKVKLRIRSMNCYEIRNELIQGKLDLGVFYADVGGFGSNLTTYPFGKYQVALTASPATSQRFRDFITQDQKMDIPFIINEPHCVFREIFEDYLQEKAIYLNPTIQLESIQTIKNLTKNDVGITFLPRFACEEEFKEGSLVEIPTDVTRSEITAVCAHNKNKWVGPQLQLLIDCITKTDQH